MKRAARKASRRIDSRALATWVEAGWLRPQAASRKPSDVDLARADLIHDLLDLGVNDEGVPVILDLIDQLHGMRRAMRELLAAIAAQGDATHYRIAARLSPALRSGRGSGGRREARPRAPS
jgi:chaperone modulatory protein CbpM